MLTLAKLWDRVGSAPRSEFLVTAGERLSYGALARLVRGWLAVFDAKGLTPGTPVAVITANEDAAVSAFIAALLDGLVPVMLTPDTPASRAAAIVDSVAPGLIVADAVRAAEGWCAGVPLLAIQPLPTRKPGGWRPFGNRPEALAAAFGLDLPEGTRPPRLPDDPDGLAYVLFTSGTTQAPSGVMLTRRNLLANLTTLSRLFAYDSSSRIFNDMVLAHGDGLVQGPLLALANGCALIRSGGFTIQGMEDWLNRVRLERASHVIAVPTVWSMIDRYARHDDYFDAPECRALLSVAARLDPDLWRRLEARFERPVFNQYGLTETVASALYAGPHPEMGAFGSIGRPVDCEARIAGADGSASGDDAPGELQLRGTNIFKGYWKNPERSAGAFTADGWMRTGDIAQRRQDGSYDILGRIKTVIMCGGFLIRPEEIDEVMTAHPAVTESATVALPDPDFGEIPVTAVVLDAPADEAVLTAHARRGLEALKVPKRILALPAIPHGEAGKPRLDELRVALRSALGAEAGPGKRPGAADTLGRVCALAAEVFRVDAASLGPGSTSDTVPGWDSFAGVNLIIAAEQHFGLRIPVALAVSMRSLGDLAAYVESARR
ncbi:MAG TPA: AMP-binding protein [Stellaceae bacterium]|nr:AMP-binding protein [Stellaceae bacterium]